MGVGTRVETDVGPYEKVIISIATNILFITIQHKVVRWGVLSAEGKKLDRCSKVIIGFTVSLPSALVKR